MEDIQINQLEFDDLETGKKYEAYIIDCRTGCTCCNSDNHYRGIYRNIKDVTQRIKFYKENEGDNSFYPIASQFARRGRYTLEKVSIERIHNDRVIIDNEVFDFTNIHLITLNEDGSLDNNELENLQYIMNY